MRFFCRKIFLRKKSKRYFNLCAKKWVLSHCDLMNCAQFMLSFWSKYCDTPFSKFWNWSLSTIPRVLISSVTSLRVIFPSWFLSKSWKAAMISDTEFTTALDEVIVLVQRFLATDYWLDLFATFEWLKTFSHFCTKTSFSNNDTDFRNVWNW